MFRKLKADEIDCRIASCNAYGVQLLLYKNARVDQTILDETVGPMNWQKHYSRDNANCVVSIWDEKKMQWIEKEDTGTESYSEKEKGKASDSFKRACFNWGIGRELYSSPNLFVFKKDLKMHWQENGKWKCSDAFAVKDIQYQDNKICYVLIQNTRTGADIAFGTPLTTKSVSPLQENYIQTLVKRCQMDNIDIEKLLVLYKVKQLSDLTQKQYGNMVKYWELIKEKCTSQDDFF